MVDHKEALLHNFCGKYVTCNEIVIFIVNT